MGDHIRPQSTAGSRHDCVCCYVSLYYHKVVVVVKFKCKCERIIRNEWVGELELGKSPPLSAHQGKPLLQTIS